MAFEGPPDLQLPGEDPPGPPNSATPQELRAHPGLARLLQDLGGLLGGDGLSPPLQKELLRAEGGLGRARGLWLRLELLWRLLGELFRDPQNVEPEVLGSLQFESPRPSCVGDPPKFAQMAPKSAQVLPRLLPELERRLREKREELQNFLLGTPKTSPDPPKIPPNPSRIPTRPKIPPNPPKIPQNPPKILQNPPKIPQNQPQISQIPPKIPQILPKIPQIPPEIPQNLLGIPEDPKIPPNSPKIPQNPPKIPQNQPQISQIPPKISQIPPKIPQIPPKTPQIPPKTPQISPQIPQNLLGIPEDPKISPNPPKISQNSQISPQNSQISPQIAQNPWNSPQNLGRLLKAERLRERLLQERLERLSWEYPEALRRCHARLLRCRSLGAGQARLDGGRGRYLLAKGGALLLKIRLEELRLLLDTYPAPTVQAHRRIRAELSDRHRHAQAQAAILGAELAALRGLGPEFRALALELGRIREDSAQKGWALRQLRPPPP